MEEHLPREENKFHMWGGRPRPPLLNWNSAGGAERTKSNAAGEGPRPTRAEVQARVPFSANEVAGLVIAIPRLFSHRRRTPDDGCDMSPLKNCPRFPTP